MADLVLRQTPLAGLLEVERLRKGDHRGFFSRFFDAAAFAEAGWPGGVAQINHTLTQEPGTIRGMHFQYRPHGEWKYVSCLVGEVYDVAVDLRRGSATYGRSFGAVLSARKGNSLLIPTGFAHGFQTLEPDCELIYLHSVAYAPDFEGGLDAVDPDLAIDWPRPVAARSPRDAALPRLNQQTGY